MKSWHDYLNRVYGNIHCTIGNSYVFGTSKIENYLESEIDSNE